MKSLLLNILLVIGIVAGKAQTPGALITSHLPNSVSSLLNPNDDSWVTTSASAFVTNDQDESEISWVGIPQLDSEPSGDLNVGGACGTTDIMDDPTSGADASYVYFSDPDGNPNSGDEYMMYRLRISRDPGNGNFGFSVLVDIDEAFGYEDTDSVEGNPGFEIEIRVKNGSGSKAVYLDDVSGTTSGTNVASYNINIYTQRSYALSQQASCSGKQAVFYDFIVPFSDIESHFGITVNDPIRLVGATSINGATVLGSTASDIAGIDDDNYANSIAGQDQAFSDFINNQKGVSSADATGFGVLPVELTKFNAEAVSGVNLITWTTGMELANDYFIVESSINGKDFKAIGEIDGNGASISEINYSFVDETPNEIIYYRLKQVDFDGTYEYSNIIFVTQKATKPLAFNINTSGAFIKVNTNGREASCKVLNMQGAVVKNRTLMGVEFVDYNDLAHGVYTMVIENDHERISERFIVR